MAPAALPSYCQGGSGSGQIINNHHLSLSQNPNPNPDLSPSPNFNNYHAAASSDQHRWRTTDPQRYVTFNNISAYSRKERRELRRRLILELRQVRNLLISNSSPILLSNDKNKNEKIKKHHHHPPPPPPPELRKLHSAMMTKCRQMLTKLMKHKGAISWFNSPVDVVRMGLPDYNRIIKNPMDLGTVKSKLAKGFYTSSPLDFASDVRLTFNNALVYNPQGHQVHRLADQLLAQFEALFAPAYAKYDSQRSTIERGEEEQIRLLINASSWNPLSTAARVFSQEPPLDLQTKPPPSPPSALELMNMKGNDHGSKTAMSIEEKQNLSYAIQNLPPEKMGEVVEIVRKRNETSQEGDEVEIDFEVMDNQTLWELDRFVTNWNHEMMMMMMITGKNKRGHETMANIGHNLQDPLSNAGNIKVT